MPTKKDGMPPHTIHKKYQKGFAGQKSLFFVGGPILQEGDSQTSHLFSSPAGLDARGVRLVHLLLSPELENQGGSAGGGGGGGRSVLD